MAKLSNLYGLNTILTDTITHNDVSHAPDGNTVYDALALKASLDNPQLTKIGFNTNPIVGDFVEGNCIMTHCGKRYL